MAALMVKGETAFADTAGGMIYPAETVIIGDSRTQGMYYAVGESDCLWIYGSGMRYDWMVTEAIPEADKAIGEGSRIVILLGVNDIGSTARCFSYAASLNEKAAQWKTKGAKTYYVGVLPVSYGYRSASGADNAHIFAWNTLIREALSEDVIFMDVSERIDPVQTVDGLHYTAETYRGIFRAISECLGETQGSALSDVGGIIQSSPEDTREEPASEMWDLYSFSEE